jgi:hypothetical protein
LTVARPGGQFPIKLVPLPRKSSSTSRRRQTRYRRRAAATELGNGSIAALNHLYSNISPIKMPCSKISDSSPISSSLGAAQHVQWCARRYARRLTGLPISAASGSPSPSRDTSGLTDFTAGYANPSPAVPLVASRVALPPADAAGSVELLSILPPLLKKQYEHENPALFRPPEEVTAAP